MTATTAASSPIVRADAEGDRRWFFGGGVHTWKVRADETNGAFLLFEDRMDRGKMTPLHMHPDAEETMYLLDGEILMHMDGHEHQISAGGIAVAPRGVSHAFMVTSEKARMLCLHTPGSTEGFYWNASQPITGDDTVGPVDFDRVEASARQHGGIEILGPPPFAH
jgi:quercetin dioxygenase-like cupin family protein